MRRTYAAIGACAAVTALVVLLDATIGLPGGVLHGRLLDGGSSGSGAASSASAAAAGSPRPVLPPEPAPSVLAPAAGATAPDPTALAAVLRPLLAGDELGSSVGGVVVDVATGDELYAQAGTTSRIPASAAKLLTSVAALEVLGPEARLATSVVLTPVSAEGDPEGVTEIVLVGGGDPSLRATPGSGGPSLRELARRTAAALETNEVSRVRLRWDASLFAPPTASPAWPKEYVASGVVAPVTALSVGNARVSDPSRSAALAFAAALERAGIDVRGKPSSTLADTDAAEVARVESRPVADLVERMLTTSDNDYAEALGHLVAVAAGEPATFENGAAATLDAVRALAVPVTGVVLDDASGLARSNRVPPATFARLLAVVSSAAHPELSVVSTGLAVAAFNGTLVARFTVPPASTGAGIVRAKTGTLTGVTALAGTVQDREGRVLAFAFLADRVPAEAVLTAPAALDEAAAALAGCGCR